MSAQDRIEQAARECVSEYYGDHPARLVAEVAALIRREREDAKAEMLKCEGESEAEQAERELQFKEIRAQAMLEASGGRLVAAYRTICGHSPMGIMSRMELAADIDALVDAGIRKALARRGPQ